MSRFRHSALLLALLVAVSSCARGRRSDPRPPGEVERGVRAALVESERAWNRGDLDGYVEVYADSVRLLPAGERGPEAARGHLARHFGPNGRPLRRLNLAEVQVRPLGASHALATGRRVLAGQGDAERAGWFSQLWARTASGWRIVHEHST